MRIHVAWLSFCSQEPPVTLEIAESRSTFFDWLLLLGAVTYSIAIYLAIRGAASTKLLESELYKNVCVSEDRFAFARQQRQYIQACVHGEGDEHKLRRRRVYADAEGPASN